MERRHPRATAVVLYLLLDVGCVLLFTLSNRETNDDPMGPLHSAWPFLAALLAGWAIARAWRRPRRIRYTAIVVWLITAVIGLTLRALTVGLLESTYVLLSTVALGVFILGWRGAAWVLFAAFGRTRRKVVDERYRR